MNTPTTSQSHASNWAARGLAATGHGIAFFGLTLAATGLSAALLTEAAFAPLGAGLPAIPGTLRAMRRLANTVRRRSADWCGVPIDIPSPPEPDTRQQRKPGLWRQLGVLLTDQATHVTSPLTAWLSVPLGVAFGTLGLWAAPRLLRCYGTLAHSILAPTQHPEPALRAPA